MVREGKSFDGGGGDGGALKKRKRVRKKNIESSDNNVKVAKVVGESGGCFLFYQHRRLFYYAFRCSIKRKQ